MSGSRRKRRGRGQRAKPVPGPGRKEQRRRGSVKAADPGRDAPRRRAPSRVVSLEPLAPVIVRSGRPFDAQAGVDPARFPPPSTLAGCLRTAWARATGEDFGPALARLPVGGPLLVRDGRVLVPKPTDALYFGSGASANCVRAEPAPFDDGAGADLPDGLVPVRLREALAGKAGEGPAWWSLDDLLEFRRGGSVPAHGELTRNGWSPQGDRRTHVGIDPGRLAAADGRLFQTEGLDLESGHGEAGASRSPGLRILARCGEPMAEALVHLGGERRLAALWPEPERAWPAPPDGWFERIAEAGGLILTLLTPAAFSDGYRPGWLDERLTGVPPAAENVRLELRAVAVARWQAQSGWDLARRRPRASRKLAAAGTTLWFRVVGEPDAESLSALWLASVSDEEQDRRDGFGLALPSAWSAC